MRAIVTVTLPASVQTVPASAPGATAVLVVSQRGPRGLQGISADNTAVYVQANPAATWTIPHMLGRLPTVAVYTDDGHPIIPDVYATTTTVVLTFVTPTAGKALIA